MVKITAKVILTLRIHFLYENYKLKQREIYVERLDVLFFDKIYSYGSKIS